MYRAYGYHDGHWFGLGYKLDNDKKTFESFYKKHTQFSCEHNTSKDPNPAFCDQCGRKRSFSEYPVFDRTRLESFQPKGVVFANARHFFVFHEDDEIVEGKNIDLEKAVEHRKTLESFMNHFKFKGTYTYLCVENIND